MSERTSDATSPLTAMASAWTQFAESAFMGATAANRAAFAAFNPATAARMRDRKDDTEILESTIPSLGYEEAGWTFERTVDNPADLTVGDHVQFSKVIDEDDVREFANASGDTNRLHLDEEFAKGSRFKGRIVHGTLAAGLISAALARLPGMTIYLSQDVEFQAPVRIGDRLTATVEVLEVLGNGQYRLSTIVEDVSADTIIIDGEAVVLIDEMPSE
ncbi:MaoC family dehydratase [Haloarchaeobius sp. HME9146]|uniref:MaoC family dehydratase n=1 Tax=Haloarchaeobius sp. HME9146 TaxID=2978732 RepID=UPI0021C0E0C0|nr:MaoC family dehydratase [Haloarchaeobius sp. HME9146]MCT9096596.1 MaoC family dehydratase [Haloarchaeobius sp. HME9146]